MPSPSHSSRFYHPHSIRWGVTVWKAISIVCSQCSSVALVIQKALRMRRISSATLSSCTSFSAHYLINDTIFGKKLLNTKCVFWFLLQILFQALLILRRIQPDIIIIYVDLHINYPIFLSVCMGTWMFTTCFKKYWHITHTHTHPHISKSTHTHTPHTTHTHTHTHTHISHTHTHPHITKPTHTNTRTHTYTLQSPHTHTTHTHTHTRTHTLQNPHTHTHKHHTHTDTLQNQLKQPQYKIHTKWNSHNTIKYRQYNFTVMCMVLLSPRTSP